MKKLTLDLNALHVESFETVPARERAGGTVEGHGLTISECLPYDDDQMTRGDSCLHTRCGASCDGNCPTNDPYRICGSNYCTMFDPSCQGTCEGRATCAPQICI